MPVTLLGDRERIPIFPWGGGGEQIFRKGGKIEGGRGGFVPDWLGRD